MSHNKRLSSINSSERRSALHKSSSSTKTKRDKFDESSDSDDDGYVEEEEQEMDGFIVDDGGDYDDVVDQEQKSKKSSSRQNNSVLALLAKQGGAQANKIIAQPKVTMGGDDHLESLLNDVQTTTSVDIDALLGMTDTMSSSLASIYGGSSNSTSVDDLLGDLMSNMVSGTNPTHAPAPLRPLTTLKTPIVTTPPVSTSDSSSASMDDVDVNNTFEEDAPPPTEDTKAESTSTTTSHAPTRITAPSGPTGKLAVEDERTYAHQTSTDIVSVPQCGISAVDEAVNDADYIGSDDCVLYWYDIHEEFDSKGTLYLFGKALRRDALNGQTSNIQPSQVATRSVCVVIKNVERNLFVLPRKYMLEDASDPCSVTEQEVTTLDVHTELSQLLSSRGITQTRMKPVEKRFVFARSMNTGRDAKEHDRNERLRRKKVEEEDEEETTKAEEEEPMLGMDEEIPKSRKSLLDPYNIVPPGMATYMQVRYSAQHSALPRGMSGKTFSHIFGSRSSLTELFLLDRGLVGPSWVTVTGAKTVTGFDKLSYCDLELVIDAPKQLQPYTPSPTDPDLPTPLFSVCSLALQTHISTAKAGQHHELVLATLRVHRSVNVEGPTQKPLEAEEYVVVRAPSGSKLPFDFKTHATSPTILSRHGAVQIAESESQFLTFLFTKIDRFNPDVLLAHDLHGTVADILISAVHRTKIGIQWSKLGRLRMRRVPKPMGGNRSLVDYGVGAGRLMLDTLTSCREFSSQKNYTLQYLMESLIGEKIAQPDPVRISEYFSDSTKLLELFRVNQIISVSTFKLAYQLEALPLTKTLTSLCGNLWMGSLRSSRSERVEYLLLHEFAKADFIAPEAYSRQELEARLREEAGWNEDEEDEDAANAAAANATKRRKPKYIGGMVLEPKRGFYEQWVAVLDFNSLYPSIIREYNICHSTTPHWRYNSFADDLDRLQDLIPDSGVSQGVLPTVVKRLIERRKAVKAMLKTAPETERVSLNIRQLALKLVANSMYGCLGFPSSRFYCQPLAALITYKGRNALDNAVFTANNQGATIIYGDTDSIMVNTNTENYRDAKALAMQVKTAINRNYKVLNIDEDGFFKNMLLLRKKKYAALKLERTEPYNEATEKTIAQRASTNSHNAKDMGQNRVRRVHLDEKLICHFKREAKGLDLVRRDWSLLSRKASVRVLDIILSGGTRDETLAQIKEFLHTLGLRMDHDEVDVEEYILTKSLTKALDQYTNTTLPHVNVARALRAKGKLVRAGDVVEYVITTGTGSQADRAVAKEDYVQALREAKINPGTAAPALDLAFYKEQQLLAPIMRLLEVFEEVTKGSIAEALGIDPAKYKQYDITTTDDDVVPAVTSTYELYKHLQPLVTKCPHCSTPFPILGVYTYVPTQSLLDARTQAQKELPWNVGTAALRFHGGKAYRDKVAKATVKSGFLCWSPTCPGAVIPQASQAAANDLFFTQLCNEIDDRVRALLKEFNKHEHVYVTEDGETFYSKDLTVRGMLPVGRRIPTQQITTELRYLASLFDIDRAQQTMAEELDLRLKRAEGNGQKTESRIGYDVNWVGTGANNQDVVDKQVVVSSHFDEKNKIIGLAPLSTRLDPETTRIIDKLHVHCMRALNCCKPNYVDLEALWKMFFDE